MIERLSFWICDEWSSMDHLFVACDRRHHSRNRLEREEKRRKGRIRSSTWVSNLASSLRLWVFFLLFWSFSVRSLPNLSSLVLDTCCTHRMHQYLFLYSSTFVSHGSFFRRNNHQHPPYFLGNLILSHQLTLTKHIWSFIVIQAFLVRKRSSTQQTIG